MTEVFIAATPHDLRWARICLSSVRFFHPEIEVAILPGAPLPSSFLREIEKYWNAKVHPLPPNHYGWGFVKLEPLFAEPGHRFLVLDADTILTGPILERFEHNNAVFLVDNELQTESETKRLYYDIGQVKSVDSTALRPSFVFNSGQWFGTSGVLERKDFDPWVEWTFPRRLKFPDVFMPGDQGVLNYVLNQKHQLEGMPVTRQALMRWPGHDNLEEVTIENLGRAEPRVIHWAGFKAPRLEALPRADLLLHFEELYYKRVPGGDLLRRLRAERAAWAFRSQRLRTKILQRLNPEP